MVMGASLAIWTAVTTLCRFCCWACHSISLVTCAHHTDHPFMPCSVLVLKKLGNELDGEFLEVIDWLSNEQQMQVSF